MGGGEGAAQYFNDPVLPAAGCRTADPTPTIVDRFSNFFKRNDSKREQPYGQAASPIRQYSGLNGYNQKTHFRLLISTFLLIP